jgi:hypothetical protein
MTLPPRGQPGDMHGRQLVTRLGMAASPGSRGPVTVARAGGGTTPTGSQAPPRKTLWEVQGGCLWPVAQVTCRHERDLKAYCQLSRVLGQLCAVIDDAAQNAIVALSVPLDQEIHPVGEVLQLEHQGLPKAAPALLLTELAPSARLSLREPAATWGTGLTPRAPGI